MWWRMRAPTWQSIGGALAVVSVFTPHLALCDESHANIILDEIRRFTTNCSTQCPALAHVLSLRSPTPLLQLLEGAAVDRDHQIVILDKIGTYHLAQTRDISIAEQFFEASAKVGSPHGNFMVGALVATSHEDAVDRHGETALFYHFAAQGGSVPATMAMGYRHLHGYNAPKSCNAALRYYKAAAEEVMWEHERFPIQLYAIPPPARLSDDQHLRPQRVEEDLQRVEFLRQRALHSTNPELLVRTASLILFSDLYSLSIDSTIQVEAKGFLDNAANLGSSSALALLGHLYAYGLAGVKLDVQQAIGMYKAAMNATGVDSPEQGIEGNPEAANGLGLVYLHGLGGINVDYERAMAYFKVAARAGHADGVHNAAILMLKAHPRKSRQYLEASADVGHLGSVFRLAQMQERHRFRGANNDGNSCETIVQLYKRVAENSKQGREILRQAAESYVDGHVDHAYRLYRIAAELGFEIAESNAAWLIERYYWSRLELPVYNNLVHRGVVQRSPEALVRAGDQSYAASKFTDAVDFYERAIVADPTNSRAMFSLGYMHHHGLGTPTKDLLLARSYYERSRQCNDELKYVLGIFVWAVDVQLFMQSLKATLWNIFLSAAPVGASQVVAVDDTATSNSVFKTGSTTSPAQTFVSAIEMTGHSRIHITTDIATHLNEYTIATWIKITSPKNSEERQTSQILLEIRNQLLVTLRRFSGASSWFVCIQMWSARSHTSSCFNRNELSEGEWHHVTIMKASVANHTKTALYVNGSVIDTVEHGPTPSAESGSDSRQQQLLAVGCRLTRDQHSSIVSGFRGQLMEFRLWDRPLKGRSLLDAVTLTTHNNVNEALVVDMQFNLHAKEDNEQPQLLNKGGELADVEDVRLRIVNYPPHAF